jgi:hypothetical protein
MIYIIDTSKFYRNSKRNTKSGPQRVYESILNAKFRDEIVEVNHKSNSWPNKGSKVIIVKDDLSHIPKKLVDILGECKVLIGPNINFGSNIDKHLIGMIKPRALLVPCKWIVPAIRYRDEIPETLKLRIWSAGIDTKAWSPRAKRRKHHYLCYVKNTKAYDLIFKYTKVLTDLGWTGETIEYGHYSERKYKKALSRSSFVIWFGNTETQGIAQFEAWSMNSPTLIHNIDSYTVNNKTFEASSSPYLNPMTGRFFNSYDEPIEIITKWIQDLARFQARKWVQNNHDIELAAQSLEELFQGE